MKKTVAVPFGYSADNEVFQLRNVSEKIPVIISITGRQEEQEPIELLTIGKYYRSADGVPTLEYEESGLSGLQGCLTSITFEGPQVTLSRKHGAESCMVFSKRQTSHSHYRVDGLELSIFPTVLEYELMDEAGWLELVYQIEMSGHHATNHLTLEYRSRESAHVQ